MKVAFTSVYHPLSNALIFEAIKKILEGNKKVKWAEVMPKAVWCHNTTVYNVRSGGSATRGGKALNLVNSNRGPCVPK
jgi:hypothetical protein